MTQNSVIKKTLLSEKPKKNSSLVATLSVCMLFLSSQIYWSSSIEWYELMAAVPSKVYSKGEIWRLFTAIGAHADFSHLLSNALSFGVLAYLCYGYFGLWIFPTAALLGGALTNALSLLTYPPNASLVGASGVVYFLGAFWITLYFWIDRRFGWGKRLLRSLGFALIFYLPTTYRPEVSERTHAIGFGLGLLFGCIYFFLNRRKIRAKEVIELDEDSPPEIVWN